MTRRPFLFILASLFVPRFVGGEENNNKTPVFLPATDLPDLKLPEDVMPPGWKLEVPNRHPCLLFDAQDTSAIKARIIYAYGSVEKCPDKLTIAWLSDDKNLQRKATDNFIAYWKHYALRWQPKNLDVPEPDGVSMRGIWRVIYDYDLAESFGLLTDAQRKEFRDALVNSSEVALGPVPGKHRSPGHAGWRGMNIYSDVVIAAATVGLMFPDLPRAREWIEYAIRILQWQLDHFVWDGAWHESPRYQGYLLLTSGLFYQSLKRRTGKDMFQDPHFKGMLDWLIRFATPLDQVSGSGMNLPGGVIMIPGIGDSSFTDTPFSTLAMWAPHYTQTDPAFAARLMWAWQRAGSNFNEPWTAALIQTEINAAPQTLGSDCSPGKGYVLMWSGFDTPQELWFLLHCGHQTLAGHDHADANGFNLYAYGAPLALDSSSQDYNDPQHKEWNARAIAHSTVIFGDRSQVRKPGKVLAFVSRPETDYSITDASQPAEVEKFVRQVVFVKPDYFVIWDQLKSEESTNWVLHTPATELQWSDHRVRGVTPWKANFDLHVVYPEAPLKPWQEKGAFGNWKTQNGPKDDLQPFNYQLYLKVPNLPNANALVVLHPCRPGDPELTIVNKGTSDKPVLEIRCGSQTDLLEMHDRSVSLRRTGPVTCSVQLDGSTPPPTDMAKSIQEGVFDARTPITE